MRSSFSPYELSARGSLLRSLFALMAVIAFAAGRGLVAAIVLMLVGVAAYAAGYELGRCPTCGKSPLKFHFGRNSEGWRYFLYVRRIWPERVCSDCRTPLDVL